MDLKERLTDDDLARPDYLAASHLHRYAIATQLCGDLRVIDLGCGTGYGSEMLATRASAVRGVDIDADSIDAARRQRSGDSLEFEVADALDALRKLDAEDVDVIVMFEALEHVPDPEAILGELERLAAGGTRMVVSVPNSRAFREQNPFHVTDFGYASMRRAFEGFGDVTMLFQVYSEGSLILGDAATGEDFSAHVGALDQAEPEYANDYIALVGFDPEVARTATARLNLVATPTHNRYMIELERANADFRRANRALARGIYGKHDAAAATVVAKFEQRLAEKDQQIDEKDRQIDELEALIRKIGDELYYERSRLAATRHRAADWLFETIRRLPVLYPLMRTVWRLGARLTPGKRG